MEDRTGRMWVSTRNGIAEFKKDSFYLYENSDHKAIDYVFQVYENSDGQIIANTRQGQYVFDGAEWDPYSGMPLKENEIIRKTILTDKGEYSSTGFELFYKDRLNKTISLWRQPADLLYFRSLSYFDNQLYVKTPEGVYRLDSVRREKIFEKELAHKTIFNYLKDSYGRWWFSTKEDGILIVQQKNGVTTQKTISVPYKDLDLVSFFEDFEKQVWVNTMKGPMKMLRPSFSNVQIKEVKPGEHIRNLIPYGENELMISISDGQLIVIHFDADEPLAYTAVGHYTLEGRGDFVDHYTFGPKGEMWMTTRDRELYLLQNNTLTNKTHLYLPGQSFAVEMVYQPHTEKIIVALDSILTMGDGDKLDTFFDADHHYIKFPRELRYINGEQLVVRTYTGEIYLYTPDAAQEYHFEKIATPPAAARFISVDHQQQLWIYNVGESISHYTTTSPSGIKLEDVINESGDNIGTQFYKFIIDPDGALWCVTNNGVQHISKGKDQQWHSEDFIVYDISQSAFADWFSIAEAGNKIWVNLRNQLIYFDRIPPVSVKKSGKVVLEDIQLNNRTTDWKNYSDSLYSYFQIPDYPHLHYYQNTLAFFYNSPTSLEYQGITYSYRLLPIDTSWSKPSTNKSVSFNQLKPDQYAFEVRCRNSGMEWGEATLFPFSIQKPFWDTAWFQILFLVVAAGFVAWVFRIRLRQERAKGEIKSQLLELEMRALRAQMNPHFIYNALNSIQSLVATKQSVSANIYISKFARLLRQVLENSRRSEITLKQELESLRLYVDLEQLRLDSQVEFVENIDDGIAPESILIPPLILQPFVENALWHGLSSKEGDKRIELMITEQEGWVQFEIRDNGIGRKKAATLRSPSDDHESTAIQVTEQRLRDFNGTVHHNPLQIEDLSSPDGLPTGTQIFLQVRKKPGFSQAV